MWLNQNKHHESMGDRKSLFQTIGDHIQAERVLYPGSYVDVSPSFVFPAVTYVDADKRAAAFFTDEEGVTELIHADPESPPQPRFSFLHRDYTTDLGLADASFDLLVSLYAGFISEACTDALRIGGTLLVNPSHGDAAMAALDPRYQLSGVIMNAGGGYGIITEDLDTYLIPKEPTTLTRASLRESGRGVKYTKSAFAYLFTRVQ